jgi:hypothetical protein
MLFARLRPTLDTPFQIDWQWFRQKGIDLNSKRLAHLCQQCRSQFQPGDSVDTLDWIDPASGEVFQVDAISEAIMSHCQWKPDYISSATPVMTGVFRALLANNNRPMTVAQLAQRLGRTDPDTLLRVLTSGPVKEGIVPTE